MRNELEVIIAELKRLRSDGDEAVFIGDDTLKGIEAAVFAETAREAEAADGEGEVTASSNQPLKKGNTISVPPEVHLPEGSTEEQWNWLKNEVVNSPVCKAHVKPGKYVVFGVGNLRADLFFCGEAPGADEEVQAEPFVGRAGQMLTRILKAMGLNRSDVYIGNIMNWRPEMPTAYGNRPPTTEEMNYCLPYLRAQVAIVRPKAIIAMGATAVTGLLGPDPKRRMGPIRGRWFEFDQTPMIVTYHPAYVLRNESMQTRRLIWVDMLSVMEKTGIPITERQRRYFTNAG